MRPRVCGHLKYLSNESAKVDDKKEYWQKYRKKEEEIELDKDEKLSLIT